jgi:eukaryotic-like serine/threonine-protein kinase
MEQLGRYEILEELSRGATGVVYKARDPLLDRLVAIKTIERCAPHVKSEVVELCFDRKARFAGRLNHPNIVTVHDMGKSGDIAYVATEFLEGQTLREILDAGVVLTPATIERIAAQIADGLAFTHQHGAVHCDVNPSSIVVLNSGLVKITHFGNALLPAGSPTLARNVYGSPKYISPEQAMEAPVDARSDIFSLGVVLYEMLTGVPPFSGTEPDEIRNEVINNSPVPPSSRNRDIPSAFDYVVARALAKDPNHRYQSAREMASDIRKLALEEPTTPPMSVAYIKNRQTTQLQPRGVTVLNASSASVTVKGDPSGQPHDGSLASGHRRQMPLYGVPALLLALGGGWTLLSRRMPRPEQVTETVESGSPVTPPSASAEVPPIQKTAEPQTAQLSVASEPPLAETGPVARLSLAVSPWGEVYVDGRKRGISPPLRELELAPGRYTVEIKNTSFPTRSQTVDVSATARLRIKHKFK